MRDYPKRSSKVTVTFIDGEIKDYEIMAGAGVSRYLAEQAGATGVLVLLNGDMTYNIPIRQIREYVIVEDEVASEGDE